ncbi:MAG: hypothetical protein PHE43_02940 [Candidatus Nanoarchaeia archaeon]|nr:hypothetical protein [Candidatus Nanoarchaeia archaeon]
MINNRGEISPVFKYIFAIIAGVLILGFFVRFAFKQVDTSEQIESYTEIRSLEDQLISLSVSSSSVIPVNFYTKNKISLDPVNCDGLVISNNRLSTSQVIFSPEEFNSNFYIWTMNWKYPFRITNFFYLADKETLFVLVGEDLAKKLNGVKDPKTGILNDEAIPEVFSVEYYNNLNVDNIKQYLEDYDKVKVVFIDSKNTLTMEDSKLEVMEIKTNNKCLEDEEMDCSGDVIIGDKKYFFLGRPSIYAAIFSSNYGCSYQRALDKLDFMNSLYALKSSEMAKKDTKSCNYLSLKTLFLTKVKSPGDYYNKATQLESANQRLKEVDCNVIF